MEARGMSRTYYNVNLTLTDYDKGILSEAFAEGASGSGNHSAQQSLQKVMKAVDSASPLSLSRYDREIVSDFLKDALKESGNHAAQQSLQKALTAVETATPVRARPAQPKGWGC
jgi:hypothetical protein